MDHFIISKEEKEFLNTYNIEAFERPSIATDIAIFSIVNDGITDDIRKLQKQSLKILLIKRASFPYKEFWALPGGFCKPGEDVSESAKRELLEETNVENAYLKLIGVFGEKNRDPRGWIISNTYMALMDEQFCKLRAGNDAWEARWFTVTIEEIKESKNIQKNEMLKETEYQLTLSNEETDTLLQATIKEKVIYHAYHKTVEYFIIENNNIAFDHAKIIFAAMKTLREDVKNDCKIVFDMMPELFTLTQLQNAFEIILNQKLVTANFRRKIAEYVCETNQTIEGVGFRPAKLFKRNMDAFFN